VSTLSVILIFVQKAKTQQQLSEQFSHLPFEKILKIENPAGNNYRIKRNLSKGLWKQTEAIFVLLSLLLFILLSYPEGFLAGIIGALAFLLISNAWAFFAEKNAQLKDPLVKRYQPLVMQNETLLIVQCRDQNLGKFIQVLHQTYEEPLAFFTIVEEDKVEFIRNKEILPQIPSTAKDLEKQAHGLAKMRFSISHDARLSKCFLSKVHYLATKYHQLDERLNNFAIYNENIQLSAEWLLENSNIVNQGIKDIRKNLPEKYFRELGFITEGPNQGIPSLYLLVSRLTAASDGRVTEDNTTAFLNAYQSEIPLTMGELWAFPLVLKIRLLECLVKLTKTIVDRVRENQLADFWANRILHALRREPEKLYSILAILSKEIPNPTAYFADQLMVQLSDIEAASIVIKGWLQRKVGEDLHGIFLYERSQQTLEQTSLANLISSLRRLEQMNWREIFEEVCPIEKILSKEALGVYSQQDFDTRDRYRHAVEDLAKEKKVPEITVAQTAVDLTYNQPKPLLQHVGYYLLDDGRKTLENALGYLPSFSDRLASWIKRYAAIGYILLCAILTGIFAFLFHKLLFPLHNPIIDGVLILISLIPFSEVAIQIVNYILAHLLRPTILPKMFFDKGIPEKYRTLTVIPTLLTSENNIRKDLERLEIHYLANSDFQVGFGLLTDFKDAECESIPEDTQLLAIANEGIKQLNTKYKNSHFFLFHRPRKLNKHEDCWMGWERKRGKLEQLNSYLCGIDDRELDNLLHEGDSSFLAKIRYILTIDSDTQLPKDSIRHLVETLSHPLNAAEIDPISQKLLRGYTIIQPRVSTSYLSANATWFARLFSDPSGVDPYAKSISDIYQDLFNEGVYHGKGLYDFKVFHELLINQLPENQILSHDLIEGSYVRTAFASDIELHDSFPETYSTYNRRHHRWVRGDWQILPWLSPCLTHEKGKKLANPLSLINRWKIFDNLRRSLLPIASVLILLIGWPTPSFLAWTLLIAAISLLPVLLQTFDTLRSRFISDLSITSADIGKGLLKTLIILAFLPHQAITNASAILVTLYRHFISRKKLLQWTISSIHTAKEHSMCLMQYLGISILSLAYAIALFFLSPWTLTAAVPLLALWICSPAICALLDRPYKFPKASALSPLPQQYLRILARKTWRYFDDFVTQNSNWLPPDNYQEKIRVEVAYRTSPTNIGMYLMSALSAHRLGYFSSQEVLQRLSNTLQTLNKLERYEGHFLNWYDIQSLSPLLPKYVSTVDSGNLLAAFWTCEEKCATMHTLPVFDPPLFFASIHDVIQLFQEELYRHNIKDWPFPSLLKWTDYVEDAQPNPLPAELKTHIEAFTLGIQEQLQQLNQDSSFPQDAIYWLQKLQEQLKKSLEWLNSCLSWAILLEMPAAKKIAVMHPEGISWKSLASSQYPSINDIHSRNVPGLIPLIGWLQTLHTDKLDSEMGGWIKAFLESANRAFAFSEDLANTAQALINEFQAIESTLNMNFLYNPDRKLFSIGYNVSDRRLDSSHYDLLASEARLASFIAIARGDVPVEHWWALGRPIAEAYGLTVLQSWGGTMFEYLMPVIWTKNFDNTLLDFACKAAVKCQIIYANQLGIPWGISESAYSRLDIHNIYQYRAFGVPSLGLKPSLDKDFVVTPYSSGLAMMIDPQTALKNLKRLDQNAGMNGIYGLYEAIDYSREYKARGQRGIIIHAYMAHHQGMSLAAFCNALYDGYLQNLFHRHPRVKALETILYERPMISHGKVPGRTKERPIPKLTQSPLTAAVQQTDTPFTPIPMSHLLSNGKYSVMVTNSGGGYSQCEGIDITRWRADVTCDNRGSFYYIRDLERNTIASTAYHPLKSLGTSYFVNFSNHSAEIKKKELGLDITTEIVVSPEDNVEIRCITLANLSMRHRHIEITSYLELALASHRADVAHPAFSKMFIETEAIEDSHGLLAHRRKRSPSDPEMWSFHAGTYVGSEGPTTFSYETCRDAFIGRDRTLANPIALERGLTNSQGCVLDPIFSIRKKIQLEPGKRLKISFITGFADRRETAIKLLEKYKYIDASLRVIEMSWTHAELDLRRLHITHEDANLFQRLANSMIFPDIQFRASPDRLKRNRESQEKLWAYGISGDNPILLVTINDIYNLDAIQGALAAHAFWHLRGFKSDIVILNEEKTSYEQPLNEHLIRMIQNFAQYTGMNKNGGIFLLSSDKMHREDQNLLYTVAHAVIITGRGNLKQQLALPRRSLSVQPLLRVDPLIPEEPSPPLPFWELLFFNGIGGFTKDGKEYAIYLDNKNPTPAPWINVISNQRFGFLASEKGLGMTWAGNSQSNRLTPWSNDPTLNPITDICYIRDDETGKFWTTSPSPIKENDPYRIRHGFGYTVYEHNSHAIEQEMTVFTPIDEHHSPVRIQILRLTNRSSRKRKLSIFTYVELVLGTDKEDAQRYVLTDWNYESKSLLAFNHYRKTFGDHVTFLSCSPSPISYTGNRKEFIGRNESLASPDALKRIQLSQTTGAGMDPCFALQTSVELYSGESTEVIIIFGEASHPLKAKELSQRYQNHEQVHTALHHMRQWWDNFLNKIQVKTPDQSLDLIFNRWLTYQNLSCRYWARSAFYQSGGAYGFRDQLQDAAALAYFDSTLTRNHILKCASRQFIEGDVQHWWHPESGNGVRTRISDDLLWLPYVALHYSEITGDTKIWDELIPYLEGRELTSEEHEAFIPVSTSSHKGTLKEHCQKAIERACSFGPHGLPLIGGGDWNDGMNEVGIQGKGESVWLAWFLMYLLNEFSHYLDSQGEKNKAEEYRSISKKLFENIEAHAWDGAWYVRAFFDDGTPIGSNQNVEDKIDSIAQSWGAINGINTPRIDTAMESVEKFLIDKIHKMILLFTPPFDQSKENPGYIKGYPAGIRENGGQYTHGALWVAMAFAKLGQAEKAMEVIQMINPINHTKTLEEMYCYRVEPYVTVADIYALKNQTGRGGWTWYTGSASLMYRVLLENIFGFKLKGNSLTIDPTIPASWDSFHLTYRFGLGQYDIAIENPHHLSRGILSIEIDGQKIEGPIPLSQEAKQHHIRITMGK